MEHTGTDDRIYWKDVGDVTNQVLRKLLEKRDSSYTSVTGNWEKIIGPTMKKYAYFDRIDRATLVIRVSNDSQKMIVYSQKKNILKRYAECYPGQNVRFIRVHA